MNPAQEADLRARWHERPDGQRACDFDRDNCEAFGVASSSMQGIRSRLEVKARVGRTGMSSAMRLVFAHMKTVEWVHDYEVTSAMGFDARDSLRKLARRGMVLLRVCHRRADACEGERGNYGGGDDLCNCAAGFDEHDIQAWARTSKT